MINYFDTRHTTVFDQFDLTFSLESAHGFGQENRSNVFEPRTDTGSVLFSYFTCLQTTTFTFLSLFALVETITLKIRERPMSWPAKCSLPVAVRGSKTLHA